MLSITDQHVLLFDRDKSIDCEATPGGKIPGHDARGWQHFAFAIGGNDVDNWTRRLAGTGIAVESMVMPPRGGTYVYFRDPDGPLIKLVTPGVWDFR